MCDLNWFYLRRFLFSCKLKFLTENPCSFRILMCEIAQQISKNLQYVSTKQLWTVESHAKKGHYNELFIRLS